MKKIIYSVLCTGLMVLSGCDYNDKYFDGLDDMGTITDVKKVEYTLTSADYTTIANNNTNKATAESAGLASELAAVGNKKYFTSDIATGVYVPVFLAGKYPTADAGSSVQLTYNFFEGLPEQIAGLVEAESYTLTGEDYESVWDDDETNYLTPLKPASAYLGRILNSEVSGAEEGDYILVTYNYSDKEPGSSGGGDDVAKLPISEDFETGVRYDAIDLPGWKNVTEVGTTSWIYNSGSNNLFAQCSAHNNGEVVASLITPLFEATASTEVTFKYIHSYYAGNSVTVWVGEKVNSTDDNDWDDITSQFDLSETGYGQFFDPGIVSLAGYAGKKVAVRFKYVGSQTGGTTTTMQIDDINIYNNSGSGGAIAWAAPAYVGTVVERNAVYQYNGTSWQPAANTVMLDPADYTEMGGSNPNFSLNFAPATYIPTYLSLNYPYAQEEDVKTVVYKYYANSETAVRADEYVFTNGSWVLNDGIIQKTEQFVKNKDGWVLDPSVTIDLPPTRGLPDVEVFMQAVVDYVKANIDEGLVDNRNNAEYYYGFSSYYNNVSFRPDYWRSGTNSPKGLEVYGPMSDEELLELQFSRLPEGFPHALVALYPNADVVDNVEVIYTINFGLYGHDGSTASLTGMNYTIQYLVTGRGQFEYIENSLQPL